MKNLILIASIGLLASCQSAGFGSSNDYAYRAVEITAGQGELDNADQFDDTEAQTTVGVTMLVQDIEGPTEIVNRPKGFVGEWGAAYSEGSGSFDVVMLPGGAIDDVTVDTNYAQLHAGLRYYFDVGPDWIQPYLGGAAAGRYYMLDAGGGDDADEFAVGFLGKAGAEVPLGDNGRLGFGYQISAGMEPDIDDVETDLDDGMFFVTLGWSF